MHGLINRSLQFFLCDTYGPSAWAAITREAGLGFDSFEAMLTYPDAVTGKVIAAAATILRRSPESLLEDLGHYLISAESLAFLRRLLRFSGVNYADFVNSLEELPDRGRLVLPDLDVPELELTDHGGGSYTLRCISSLPGAGFILLGMLRAMADDYGALVLLDPLDHDGRGERISIQIADQQFNEARPFNLGLQPL